jgi:hypothetical protein
MTYVSPIAVLQEAGLWDRQVGENLSGPVDGTNKAFTTQYKPLVQTTSGAEVTSQDVSVYVDGLPVAVGSVDAPTGALTLVTAPSESSDVSGDYASSAVSHEDVAGVIEEAEDWIALELTNVFEVPDQGVSPTLRKIGRFYAAGLLMSREYGLESVTEETTKEGKRKIQQAEEWLKQWRMRHLSNSASTVGYNVPRSTEDQRLFDQPDQSSGGWRPLDPNIRVQRRQP